MQINVYIYVRVSKAHSNGKTRITAIEPNERGTPSGVDNEPWVKVGNYIQMYVYIYVCNNVYNKIYLFLQ